MDSLGGVRGRVTVGNRWSQGGAFLVSFSASSLSGERLYRLPQAWRDYTGLSDQTVRGGDGTEGQRLYAKATWRQWEWGGGLMRRQKEVFPSLYFTSTEFQAHGDDERAYTYLRYTGSPRPDATLTARVSLDWYRYDGLFAPAKIDFNHVQPQAESLWSNAEVRWQQTVDGRHTFVAGLEGQVTFREQIGRYNRTRQRWDIWADQTSHYVSPFAQADLELRSDLWASLGGRWDDYSTGEEKFSPRVGLIWEPRPSTTLKVIYGESFRVPNLEERHAPEAGMVANTSLRPETNRSFELVATHRVNAAWELEANFFRTESQDLIRDVPYAPIAGYFTYSNDQAVLSRGAELGATAFLPNDVQIRLSGTVQRAYDVASHREMYDAPEYLTKVNVSVPLVRPWLRLSADLQWVGPRRDTAGDAVPGQWGSGVTLRAVRLWHRWDLSLSARNLLTPRTFDPKNEGQIRTAPGFLQMRVGMEF